MAIEEAVTREAGLALDLIGLALLGDRPSRTVLGSRGRKPHSWPSTGWRSAGLRPNRALPRLCEFRPSVWPDPRSLARRRRSCRSAAGATGDALALACAAGSALEGDLRVTPLSDLVARATERQRSRQCRARRRGDAAARLRRRAPRLDPFRADVPPTGRPSPACPPSDPRSLGGGARGGAPLLRRLPGRRIARSASIAGLTYALSCSPSGSFGARTFPGRTTTPRAAASPPSSPPNLPPAPSSTRASTYYSRDVRSQEYSVHRPTYGAGATHGSP